MPPKPIVLGGDLETDNDGSRAWVCQWAISDGQEEKTGRELNGFEFELLQIMSEKPAFLYFHNLKYDLEFFKYSLKSICQETGSELHIIMRQKAPISLTVMPPKGSGLHKLMIRDSLKKFAGELREIAKSVGMKKLDGFDFYQGWSDDIDYTNRDNWDYIKMDAKIVAVAMKELHNLGNDKATFSGDAWNTAKKVLGTAPDGRIYHENYAWNRYFPKLDYELDKKLRYGYYGGINISNHRGINEGELLHADVNSMYPSVMYYDPLPHGLPTYCKTKPPKGNLFVVKGFFKLRLRRGMIPWFQFRNSLDNIMEKIKVGTPIINTKHWHELTLTNIDLELLHKFYHVKTQTKLPLEYWVFKKKIGIFRKYIDKFLSIKNENEKKTLLYEWAKFMMNSLYGRFGLNPESNDTELIEEGEDLKFEETDKINEDNDAYLPYAMFITAHARRRLLDYVVKCGPKNVIHCDTDSVIHYGKEICGINYSKNLGDWGIECKPVKILEGGFKRYVEYLEPEINSVKSLSMACAGVPQKKNDNEIPYGMWIEILDNPEKILSDDTLGNLEYTIKSEWLRKLYIDNGMNPDKVNTMKLIPKKVFGGVVLADRQHKLNDGLIMRGRFR